LSSLRDAFAQASESLQEQVTAFAVGRLKKTSSVAAQDVREVYGDFFQTMHERVLNDPAISDGNSAALPSLFRNSGIAMRPWHALSDRWMAQKERVAEKSGDLSSYAFYKGITSALAGTTFSGKGKKRKGGKKRSSLSLDMFIQSLAMGGNETVEGFFGPVKLAYSLERPDKGKTQIVTLDSAITTVRQWKPKGSGTGFIKAMDGTVLTVTITAFPNVEGMLNDRALIGYMISKSGYKEQWFKLVGGSRNNRMRPVLLPLINWYAKVKLKQTIEGSFE